MSDDSAKAALEGTRFAQVRRVERTGSTNADLLAAARAGAGEQTLVADVQDAGRGRLERHWTAPAGASLLMSVLVRPPFPERGAHLLGSAMGLAALQSLEHLTGLRLGLKWPNDLVAPGAGPDGADAKLGGLLSELGTGEGGDAVVVGIGVNLAWADVGFPAELVATATSVDLLGAHVARDDLVVELLTRFDSWCSGLDTAAGCEALLAQYSARCVTLGRRVRVELPVGELVGTAAALDPSGALVVRSDEGVEHVVTVGDVVHLRPG